MSWRRFLAGIIFAALVGVTSHAGAAPQATATGSADAEVVGSTLSLTAVDPLAFGRIKSTGPGTVIIDVNPPQRSFTGGVVLIGSGSCTTPPCDVTNQSNDKSASFWSPAIYTVAGTPGATYHVNFSTTATATLNSGSSAPTTLQVTDVNVGTGSSNWASATGTLDPSGNDTIRIGGTLQVTTALNASSYYLYSVDVPITVQYN